MFPGGREKGALETNGLKRLAAILNLCRFSPNLGCENGFYFAGITISMAARNHINHNLL